MVVWFVRGDPSTRGTIVSDARRRKIDWVAVLDAAYAPPTTLQAWGAAVYETAVDVVGHREHASLLVIEHSNDGSKVTPLFVAGWRDENVFDQLVDGMGPRLIRDFFYPPTKVAWRSDIVRRLPVAERAFVQRMRERTSWVDAVGVLLHPLPGVAGVLFAGRGPDDRPDRHEQRRLAMLAIHLEAGLRLQRRPESVVAVLGPDGKLVHRERSAPGVAPLARAVQKRESARKRGRCFDARVLDTWTALIDGRVSLVERREGTRRFYWVLQNDRGTRPMRALSPIELEVLTHASSGLPSHLVAYALGMSESRVSSHLRSAALKAGVATGMDLVRIAAIVARDPRASFDDIALTTAERHVLQLLEMGYTNAEIARIRHRSIRTIANQVAALLRKTGSPSRRTLLARRTASNR